MRHHPVSSSLQQLHLNWWANQNLSQREIYGVRCIKNNYKIKKKRKHQTSSWGFAKVAWLVIKEEKEYYNYKAISVEFGGHDPVIRSQGVASQQLINSGGKAEENRRARKSELAVFAVKRGKKGNKKHVQTQGDHNVSRLRGIKCPCTPLFQVSAARKQIK